MPWLSIVLAVLSFFMTKKSTGSTGKALLAAGLVGGATYGVTHYTDWGQANLGSLDGVVSDTPLLDANGNPIVDASGNPITAAPGSTVVRNDDGTIKSIIDNTGKVLTSWGGVGTAAVIGAGALASSGDISKYLPWIIGGVGIFLLTK